MIQTTTVDRPAERKRKTKFNDSSFVTTVRMIKTKQKSLAFFFSFVRRPQFVYLKYQKKNSQRQSTTFHMSYLDKCQSQDHISCSVQDVLNRNWAKTFATTVNFVGSFITWQYWSALHYTRDRRASHSSFSNFDWHSKLKNKGLKNTPWNHFRSFVFLPPFSDSLFLHCKHFV